MELQAGASLLSRPADEFTNDSSVEELWAEKACEHAETYFDLICTVDPRTLRLTPFDDEIYTAFRQHFPKLEIRILDDDMLKSNYAKKQWREFAELFQHVEDYSFGTLMRADSDLPFEPDNALLVVRIQFLAIELARNREFLNDWAYQTFHAKADYSKYPTSCDGETDPKLNIIQYMMRRDPRLMRLMPPKSE